MAETVRLGTRGSALALAQSRWVQQRLEAARKGLRVELIEIASSGDRQPQRSLRELGAGVFVRELERALAEDKIDLAVHSLKDLPVRQPDGLVVAAVPAREDARDAAVCKDGLTLAQLPNGSYVGTGSPRRRAQIKMHFPQLHFRELRGNVDTRIQKIREGVCDAAILACAGLKRLGLLEQTQAEILPLEKMLPAPGQGALGLECRRDDARVKDLLKSLHDQTACACVAAERACLEGLGGGCHLPLGAYACEEDGKLRLRALLALPDGSMDSAVEERGSLKRAAEIGKRAADWIRYSPQGKVMLERLTEDRSNPESESL